MKSATIALIKEHKGLLFCGFMLYFFSGFGQSIFFGPYLPAIQQDLGLTKTELGLIYAVATIASSILIIFTGKGLDHLKLRDFIALSFIGLSIGCFVLAFSHSIIILLLAFLLLRQFGQGLPVLAASTSINRYLDTGRGKATAFIALGGSFQIIVFPMMALLLEEHIDWRTAWMIYGGFVLIFLLPGFWLYLRSHQHKTHEKWEARIARQENTQGSVDHWTRMHVLKDWRFYGLIALMILAPFISTAIFFYQRDIAQGLGISPIAFAASFPIFTACSVLASFSSGALIDKYGEKPILASFPITYTIGLTLLTSDLGYIFGLAGMAFIGCSNGMIMATGGPLLASLYGTKHLGSIKSMLFSTSVLGSALSPSLFGYFMDQGIDIMRLLSFCALYTAVVWLLAFPICKNKSAQIS